MHFKRQLQIEHMHATAQVSQNLSPILKSALNPWITLIQSYINSVLEIKKISRLSVCQKPGNQTPDFGCPDENLVVLQGCP